MIYVIIDELSSLAEAYETKKEREEFHRKFGEMLRLSRNLGDYTGGFRFIVGLQQADASFFGGTSTRSNFGIKVALGGISKEGIKMLFDVTDASDKPKSSERGKGFAQIEGKKTKAIMIPYEENREHALSIIKNVLERPLE